MVKYVRFVATTLGSPPMESSSSPAMSVLSPFAARAMSMNVEKEAKSVHNAKPGSSVSGVIFFLLEFFLL